MPSTRQMTRLSPIAVESDMAGELHAIRPVKSVPESVASTDICSVWREQ